MEYWKSEKRNRGCNEGSSNRISQSIDKEKTENCFKKVQIKQN